MTRTFTNFNINDSNDCQESHFAQSYYFNVINVSRMMACPVTNFNVINVSNEGQESLSAQSCLSLSLMLLIMIGWSIGHLMTPSDINVKDEGPEGHYWSLLSITVINVINGKTVTFCYLSLTVINGKKTVTFCSFLRVKPG